MQQYAIAVIGMDIGDKYSHICVLEADGDPVEETRIPSTPKAVERYFGTRAPAIVALEVGGHSRWVSQDLESYGHTVLVANARQLRLIYESDKKNDRSDAEILARVARMDPKLLHPITHRSEECQEALAFVRVRDALVRSRTLLINHARGIVKSTGERLPSCASDRFHKVGDSIPPARKLVLDPLLGCVQEINEQIKSCERTIETLCVEKFPETRALRQVPGVGPITALAFVLSLEDPGRFPRGRMVGSYLGLRPRQSDSGLKNPQLRITKAGNSYLRRLLVSSAQYILGPFGPDTDLRRWGLRLAERGGKNAKKRAVVAVARKLAVLLHKLWTTQEAYEPLYQSEKNDGGPAKEAVVTPSRRASRKAIPQVPAEAAASPRTAVSSRASREDEAPAARGASGEQDEAAKGKTTDESSGSDGSNSGAAVSTEAGQQSSNMRAEAGAASARAAVTVRSTRRTAPGGQSNRRSTRARAKATAR